MLRFIDEKGKLFGKINIVDFLVIIFFFCLVPAFYFGYKIITHKPMVPLRKEFVEIELDCQLVKLEPELLKLISVGDKGLNDSGQAVGEIISLGESGPYKYELDIGGEEKVIRESTDLKQLKAKLRLKAVVQQDKLYYRERYLVKVGSPFEFSTRQYSLWAVPIQERNEEIIIELDCQLIKLKPELLKLISVGDKGLNDFGQVIGEIISLGESGPYKYELDIGGEEKVIRESTDLKQLKAKLRLKAVVQQDKLYYRERYLVKVGSPFEFSTRQYSLWAIPLKGKEEKKDGGQKSATVKLTVHFKNLLPELIKVVKSGDRQLEIAKSNIKKIIAKIDRVVSNEPSEAMSLMNDSKTWNIVGHPKYRDLVLEIEALCIRKPEGLFLKDKQVKIGKPLEFSTDLYSISGVIIGIETR